MNLLQLFRCLRGLHHRDHHAVWNDGTADRSYCTGCGKRMIRQKATWRIDDGPEPERAADD